jgi:hypothetical protein
MVVHNNLLILVKLLLLLSIFFLGEKTWISLVRPVASASCTTQSVDLKCFGSGCTTPPFTVSGSLCTNYFTLRLSPCDLDSSNEYVQVFINGVNKYNCNPTGYKSNAVWWTCGNYYYWSRKSFTVYLKASPYVWSSCHNYAERLRAFTVFGRMVFSAKSFSVTTPTISPTLSPTPNPTLSPTRNPTNLPTSLSSTIAPTSPCVNKWAWCDYAEKSGMCYAKDDETRIFIINDCPVSCGTCFNSTLGPTSAPTHLVTLSPTPLTMSPSRKPSREPSHRPTAMPTASPTCIDEIQFCAVIESFCNSSHLETKRKMATVCAATCASCTLEPTVIPTTAPTPCEDSYAYCSSLAQNGACYEENRFARLHFQNYCPVSCGTCNNRTVSPTSLPSRKPTNTPTKPTSAPSLSPSVKPTSYPTRIPTGSPTCIDTITYCKIIQSYCRNTDPYTLIKMLRDCAATCGYCIRGDRRRLEVVDSISSRVGPMSVTDVTQVEAQHQFQLFYNVWILPFVCCTLVSLLVLICKCSILNIKGQRQNQGDFVTLLDEQMVHEPLERSCLRQKEIDATKDEGEANC